MSEFNLRTMIPLISALAIAPGCGDSEEESGGTGGSNATGGTGAEGGSTGVGGDAAASGGSDSGASPAQVEADFQDYLLGLCESAQSCDDAFVADFEDIDGCIEWHADSYTDDIPGCKEAAVAEWKCQSLHYTCDEWSQDACPTEVAAHESICFDN